MTKYQRRARMKKNKEKTHEERIIRLENQILDLKAIIGPMALEQEAIIDARDKFMVTCDASYTQKNEVSYAAIGYVIRSAPLSEPIVASMPTTAKSSNEAELDAIYNGLRSLPTSLHTATIANDYRIKETIVVTDSKAAISWLEGTHKPSEALEAKVETLKELILNIRYLTQKPLRLVWKNRNSTADLIKANQMAQYTLGVKNR